MSDFARSWLLDGKAGLYLCEMGLDRPPKWAIFTGSRFGSFTFFDFCY